MSFILDALKKSETDRQRQSGPALYEVKIAAPRRAFPLWAVALVLLLGINIVIGGWLLFRHNARPDESNSSASATTATAHPEVGSPAPAGATAAGSTPAESTPAHTSVAPAAPVSPAPALRPDPAAPQTASTSTGVGDSHKEPTLAASSGGAEQTNSPATGASNPDDFAPATEPNPLPGLPGHVKRGTSSGLVLYQDAAVVPGANLPQLRLDLHVYAPKPQDRFALVNMHRLREGDSLPEGVRVESITPDGVIMSHNGLKFLLPRE